jgi:hypothetical protein
MKLKTFIQYSSVAVAGIVIRIYFANYFGFDWDASFMVYQAYLVSHGAIMFSQIRIEEPLYIYLLSLFNFFLGPQIWNVKVLSLICSLIIAYFVYLISREIFGKRVAWASLCLYMLIPVVAIFDVQSTYRTVFQVPTIASLFLVLLGVRTKKWHLAFVGGLLIGVDIWLYAGSIFYGLLIALVPFVYSTARVVKRGIQSLTVISGVVSGFVVIIPILLLLGSSLTLITEAWFPSITAFSDGSGGPTGGRFSSLGTLDSYFMYIIRYTSVESRNWMPLIIVGLIFLGAFAATGISRSSITKKAVVLGVLAMSFALYFLALFMGINLPPHGNYGLFDVSLFFIIGFIAEIVILVPVSVFFLRSFSFEIQRSHKIMALWLLVMLIFLGSFQVPHGFYFQFFAAPLCTIGGYIIQVPFSTEIVSKYTRKRIWIGVLLIGLVAFSGILGAAMFESSTVAEWSLSAQQISSVGAYLNSHTNASDQIFTAAPIYATAADRTNAGNFDNYFYFVNSGTTNINYSSTIETVYTLMGEGIVKYVVLDPAGRTQTLLNAYPALDTLFLNDYQYATTIDGASIWKFDPCFNLANNLAHVSAYTGDGSLALRDGVWFYQKDPLVFVLNPSDKNAIVDGNVISGETAFQPPPNSSNGLNPLFLNLTIPNFQFDNLNVSYAISDVAFYHNSTGVNFQVKLGNSPSILHEILNVSVNTNDWHNLVYNMTQYKGQNVSLLLSSTAIGNYAYSWLIIDLRFFDNSKSC